MKQRIYFDGEAFVDQATALAGQHLRRWKRARLGHPVTGAVRIPRAEADYPGQVWLHESGTAYAQVDTGDSAREDDSISAFTGLLKPNTIPKSQIVFGLPVLIKEIGGIWEVADTDGLDAAQYLDGVPEMALRSVDISELDYGLLRPTNPTTMVVLVTEALYTIGGALYAPPTLQSPDLSSYTSGLTVGAARALQILIDPAAATLAVVASAPFPDNRDALTGISDHAALFAFYPKTTSSSLFNAGWVKVYANMRAIELADIWVRPELLAKSGGAGVIDLILTDEDGNVLVDDNGNVLYGEE